MMRTLSGNLALAVLLIGGVVRAADPPTFPAAATADEWAKTFQTPPDQARPWVYWMFMDGNLTREGMTADLEAMKRAGIGGAIILEVNIGIPRDRPVHERTLASVAEARHPRSRSPRAGNRPGRRAGVVRHRRAVGQTRAINAASRRQRDEGDGADALRSPVAATQTTHPLLWRNHVDPSTAQGVGRILPGRGGAGVPHAHRHLPDPGRK